MSAKPLRTRSKSASADRCLRPLGATIDMATPDPKTSNGFSVQGIFAWGFTKRQPGGRGGYRVLSLSGNCWKSCRDDPPLYWYALTRAYDSHSRVRLAYP